MVYITCSLSRMAARVPLKKNAEVLIHLRNCTNLCKKSDDKKVIRQIKHSQKIDPKKSIWSKSENIKPTQSRTQIQRWATIMSRGWDDHLQQLDSQQPGFGNFQKILRTNRGPVPPVYGNTGKENAAIVTTSYLIVRTIRLNSTTLEGISRR